jgi:hypothetical protein
MVEFEEACEGPEGVDTVWTGSEVEAELSSWVGASDCTCCVLSASWAVGAIGNDWAGDVVATGDLGFLSGDRATDRASVNAAGRSVLNAMAGLILGFGLAAAGTFGSVGLVPVGVTSLDLFALG